jgi:hypothetical protein
MDSLIKKLYDKNKAAQAKAVQAKTASSKEWWRK